MVTHIPHDQCYDLRSFENSKHPCLKSTNYSYDCFTSRIVLNNGWLVSTNILSTSSCKRERSDRPHIVMMFYMKQSNPTTFSVRTVISPQSVTIHLDERVELITKPGFPKSKNREVYLEVRDSQLAYLIIYFVQASTVHV